MENQDIRVAIFEDNRTHRDALCILIAHAEGMCCVGAFPNANHLEADIGFCKPDVVFMDIEMPRRSGIEATQAIKQHFPEIKVLMQTVFDEQDKIFYALCAGASGYILKSDSPEKQLDAIREVYAGGGPMSASIAQKVLAFFRQQVIAPQFDAVDIQLSEREYEILKWLKDGLSGPAIAEKAFISYETVRTHLKNIYKKLHVANRTEAVIKAKQRGLF
ncbi:response regulator [Parapedobacter sp.]